MDCSNCGRSTGTGWPGSKCPYCGATLMDVATTILALAGAAELSLAASLPHLWHGGNYYLHHISAAPNTRASAAVAMSIKVAPQ